MGCTVTKSLKNANCDYTVAGARKVYLTNWYPAAEGVATVAGKIVYTTVDGVITDVILPEGEKWYEVDGAENTLSFTDNLAVGGAGSKYRTHAINVSLGTNNAEVLEAVDGYALGRLVGVVVDAAGRPVILGRTGGLTAPADGANYASGAAEADAAGWTFIWQGGSIETHKLLSDAGLAAVMADLDTEEVVP